MQEYTTVSARIDSGTKREGDAVLRSLGLTPSAAISTLYAQIVLRNGLPFEVAKPPSSDHGVQTTRTLQAAQETPELREGLSILMQKSITHAAQEYGASRVWLFGSRAREEATKTSDIDLYVEPGEMRGMAIGGFSYDIEAACGLSVDVVVSGSDGIDDQLLQAIERDKVLLYGR